MQGYGEGIQVIIYVTINQKGTSDMFSEILGVLFSSGFCNIFLQICFLIATEIYHLILLQVRITPRVILNSNLGLYGTSTFKTLLWDNVLLSFMKVLKASVPLSSLSFPHNFLFPLLSNMLLCG